MLLANKRIAQPSQQIYYKSLSEFTTRVKRFCVFTRLFPIRQALRPFLILQFLPDGAHLPHIH
ncbi:hypothetical protein F4009_23880 [Candidatus Poribacteria bacterium]|nr:hypothetical protein [Candidatus Poribacteria bacterium]MYK96997.1 hypothetical protein [Candidatus Poribacteria bacterium]